MRATAEPVDARRVRLTVEVDAAEVDEALDATVRRLARQLRVPGFRPGKVPRQVLEARMGGPAALRRQAISDALPDLYARAVSDTELDPIAAPEIDVTSGGEDDGPVRFDAVVEVRPTVAIPGYSGLVVTVPAVEVSDDDVQRQIDRLRQQSGELAAVERPAADGDYVTIDLHGTRHDGEDVHVEDLLVEVGSASDVPGLDDHLRGATPGDVLEFEAPAPGAAPSGGQGRFRVLVKEVKQKIVPDPTDEWASEVSEFDSLQALRDDLRRRLHRVRVMQAQLALRDGAVDALIGLVDEEPPTSLVDAEVRDRLHDLGHQLEARRMTVEQYLAVSGRDEESLLAELRAQATRAVLLDLALRALADAEHLEVSDDELDQVIADLAAQTSTRPSDLRARLDRAGRLPAVRSDRRKAKALAWLLEHVAIVDEEGRPVDRRQLEIDAEAGEPDGRSEAVHEPAGPAAAAGTGPDSEAQAEEEAIVEVDQ